MTGRLFLFTDGASRGNPGPAAAGAILKNQKGEVLLKKGHFRGRVTNNEAEYRALILGLKLARKTDPEVLVCLLDSKLVVSQIKGLYRVKKDHLARLLYEVRRAEEPYRKVFYKLIPREKNGAADALANEVLDRR